MIPRATIDRAATSNGYLFQVLEWGGEGEGTCIRGPSRGKATVVKSSFQLDSAYWRRLASLGAAHGPELWLRLSPPPIGLLVAALSPHQRAHIRQNLQSIFGPRNPVVENADVALTFMQYAQNLAESLALQGKRKEALRLNVRGEENLHAALDRGNGMILGTAHTAGWEAALMALESKLHHDVLVVMQKERDAKARAFHALGKASSRRRVLVVGDDPLAALALRRHLKKGGIVAIQVDRALEDAKSYQIPFGRKTWVLPTGPFVLSAVSRAPIVLVLSARTGFFSYDLQICEPIDPPAPKSDEQMLLAARRVAGQLARHVYAKPNQWFDFAPAP